MSRDTGSIRKSIESGNTSVGIELGSTRIKAVLIDEYNVPIASGSYDWENSLINGIWTYSLQEIWAGVQGSFQKMTAAAAEQYGVPLRTTGAIGFSGMMHGYMAFDRDGNLLTPFRTWRNSTTGPASAELTELFSYPVPQRWSIAHLYQAILNGEEHGASQDACERASGVNHLNPKQISDYTRCISSQTRRHACRDQNRACFYCCDRRLSVSCQSARFLCDAGA